VRKNIALVTLKRHRDDEDKDEEPSVGSNPGSKRRREGKGLESTSATDDQSAEEASQHPNWFQKQAKPPTPDRAWNKTLSTTHGRIQPWINNLAKKADSRTSFNELMDTPVDFSAFVMNQLKVDTLTPELLVGLTYKLMKGSCKSLVELEVFLEEVYKATTDQLDLNNPKGQQYPHDLLKPLPFIPNSQGRHVIPFNHFINNNLEYLRGGIKSYQKKLYLTKPDTYRSDLKCKEAYTAYSNPRGFIYQNKDKQNRLMRIDELYKFSDDTLNDVWTALDDLLKGIWMQKIHTLARNPIKEILLKLNLPDYRKLCFACVGFQITPQMVINSPCLTNKKELASPGQTITEKPAEFAGFEQIIDFLKSKSIHYALTVNHIIYVSFVKQFWAMMKVKKVNNQEQIQALVDKKNVIITEDSIRSDLCFEDAKGTAYLLNEAIFEGLARMGTMASAIICLANNQKFNFLKYIFDNMVKCLEGRVKFYLFLRFLQVFLEKQVEGMARHKDMYILSSHTKKIFTNMRRIGAGFSTKKQKPKRKQRKEAEVSNDELEDKDHVPTPSSDPLPSGDDSFILNELMVFCSSLQEQIIKDVSTAEPVTTADEVVTTTIVKDIVAPTTDVIEDEITMLKHWLH
nr:hypothetical protein [Tanacetum cinerariifolium]